MPLSTLADRQQKLIRKAQDAAVFAAADDAIAVTAITTGATGTLIALPDGYVCLGHHTEDDGVSWSREVDTADTRSHGSTEPTRRDIVSDVAGLVVLAQETKMITLEMFHNIDLTGVIPDATTGEIAFSRSSSPSTRYYRLLAVASDGAGDDTIYFGRFCPRASLTAFDDQAWTKGEELRWPLTFTAYRDDALGYSMREMWGGPGLAALTEDMGF